MVTSGLGLHSIGSLRQAVAPAEGRTACTDVFYCRGGAKSYENLRRVRAPAEMAAMQCLGTAKKMSKLFLKIPCRTASAKCTLLLTLKEDGG